MLVLSIHAISYFMYLFIILNSLFSIRCSGASFHRIHTLLYIFLPLYQSIIFLKEASCTVSDWWHTFGVDFVFNSCIYSCS